MVLSLPVTAVLWASLLPVLETRSLIALAITASEFVELLSFLPSVAVVVLCVAVGERVAPGAVWLFWVTKLSICAFIASSSSETL